MYRVCLLEKVMFGQKMRILVSLTVECVKSIKICNCSCNLCSFCWFSEKGFEGPGVQKYILAFISELPGATRQLHFFCSISPGDIGVKAATAKNRINLYRTDISPLDSSRLWLAPLCFVFWKHQTIVIHWFPWLVSNTLFTSWHQSLYFWHPLIMSCLWQNWCSLFPSTDRYCCPK